MRRQRYNGRMSKPGPGVWLVGPEPGRLCGIADYVQALRPEFSPWAGGFLSYNEALHDARVTAADALLVHYERSLVPGPRYLKSLAARSSPLFVVPHEVYAEDPFAFPRADLRAPAGWLWAKRLHYHWSHRAFAREVALQRRGYHARRVFPLNAYARSVLETRCPQRLGPTIPLAAVPVPPAAPPPLSARDYFPAARPAFILGVFGFLTATNDYGAVWDVLTAYSDAGALIVGGPRLATERAATVLDAARTRGLEARVAVTGFVPENRLGEALAVPAAFLFPARFKSSSSTLLRLSTLGKPIVAADLPLTRELQAAGVPLLLYRDRKELLQRVAEIRAGVRPPAPRYAHTPASVAAAYAAALAAALQ